MNLQEMISKMNPQMLQQGLKQVSAMLSPEQMKQVEAAIKNVDKGALNPKLNALNSGDLQKELQSNPALAKELAKNPQLMKQLNNIFSKPRG